MHAKTMEGLMGAGINRELSRTPMRVFKEARRKGDVEGMERAMGYVNDCGERAENYQKKAEKGMDEDAKAARETEKAIREKALEKRKEEKEKLEERTEAAKREEAVVVEISEAGKALCKKIGSSTDGSARETDIKSENVTDAVQPAGTDGPGVYAETGDSVRTGQGGSFSVSV